MFSASRRGLAASSGEKRSSSRSRTWIALDDLVEIALEPIDQVQQDGATLDMPEELVPEADPLGRTFDDPGDIGDDEGRSLYSTTPRLGSRVVNG